MSGTIERFSSNHRLPRPAPGRLRPLRAGIRNIWEYDNQEFWFSGGRLILRGQNTAGKSKALELLLPFVLDGDIRPQRLDPFGSVSKTMYWNLIDFGDRDSAIGYSWVEFGHVDQEGVEGFVTCIVGMRASRSAGKRVDTWFAVTPARIGHDLELAPGDVPLTADKLRIALPERSAFSTSAREHRAAVDHALFGLGPERYDALLHLLLQLRRPKLSEKLDMARLGDYLRDALPPLEHHKMDRLALAFARLDEETHALERLERSTDQLHSFLELYRAHARVQTRLRADEVRSATSKLDEVTKLERAERERLDQASTELQSVDSRLQELAEEIIRMTGQLDGLDLSKVHALQEVARRASIAERTAAGLRDRASEDRALADVDRRLLRASEAAAVVASGQRDRLLGSATEFAVAAGVGLEHELHTPQLLADPDGAQIALRGVASRREELLQRVRVAAGAAEVARLRIDADRVSAEEAEASLESARAELASLEEAVSAAVADLVASVAAWSVEWEIAVPEEWSDSLLAGLRRVAGPLLDSRRQVLREARATTEAARAAAAALRATTREQLALVEAEADLAPRPRPGSPEVRPPGFSPLWACVEFSPALSQGERAHLEAALEASGVLSALIGPDGAVLDPSTLDTWVPPASSSGDDWRRSGPQVAVLAADSSGSGLTGLVPAAAAPLPQPAVAAALARLAASGSWSTDGSWAMGPLQGRWTKPAAEFVGAAARAEARRRRIAELTEALGRAEAELAVMEAELARLRQQQDRLDRAEAAWPTAEELRDARRDRERQSRATEAAVVTAQRAEDRLARSRSEGQAAFDEQHAAEDQASCRAASVDAALAAMSTYREALASAVGAVRSASIASVQAGVDRSRLEGSEARAAGSARAAFDAGAEALSARAEAEELRRTSGADAEAVLDRQRQLTEACAAARRDEQAQRQRRDAVLCQVATAEARLEEAEVKRKEREQLRAVALERQASVATSELASLALGPVDEGRDFKQVTAGLGFARMAFERLREVAVDQRAADAVSTRFHNGITTLQSELGTEFNPYLDTSDGLEVCFATLNGQVVALSALSTSLDEQLRRRRETLTADERELIHQHLLTEVGSHLGDRVHAAWALTNKMNDQLAAHPTRSGVRLALTWEVAPDAGPGAEQAAKLLRQSVHLLDEPQRVTLANFLHDRVRAAREGSEGADMTERLTTALDYRLWHRFAVHRLADGRRERLTSRTQGLGSGGEQAKLAHLPLFSATAAYYASARADAPHLLMLDEAFAGIDDTQRGDCMGMLVDLDLDMVLTNYSEWGCYQEVPSVAVYHLERTPGRPGVSALRFVWDGTVRAEDDPWLDEREAAASVAGHDGGLFG